MNKKGFTLVELLGVIAVLAIVGGMVVVSMTGVIGTGKKGTYKTYEKTFALSAQNYLTDYPDEEPVENSVRKIYLRDLVSGGYIDVLQDPNGGNCNDLVKNSYVLVSRPNAGYNSNYKLQYNACLICVNGDTETYISEGCDNINNLVQVLAKYIKYTPHDGMTCSGGVYCDNVQLILDKIAKMVK